MLRLYFHNIGSLWRMKNIIPTWDNLDNSSCCYPCNHIHDRCSIQVSQCVTIYQEREMELLVVSVFTSVLFLLWLVNMWSVKKTVPDMLHSVLVRWLIYSFLNLAAVITICIYKIYAFMHTSRCIYIFIHTSMCACINCFYIWFLAFAVLLVGSKSIFLGIMTNRCHVAQQNGHSLRKEEFKAQCIKEYTDGCLKTSVGALCAHVWVSSPRQIDKLDPDWEGVS